LTLTNGVATLDGTTLTLSYTMTASNTASLTHTSPPEPLRNYVFIASMISAAGKVMTQVIDTEAHCAEGPGLMPEKPKTRTQLMRAISPGPTSQQQYDRNRGEDRQFYGTARWRKLRQFFLRRFPICAECERQGQTRPANEVHHKMDRQKRPDLAFDQNNLESLCKSCHSRETRKRSGNLV
jgi:5-methylcytosine-specific restriction protein A